MKIFITGATGFIGTHLTEKLLREGHEVTIMIRKISAAEEFRGKNLNILNGDIFSSEKLQDGMKGCDWVFHLAAYAKPYSRDKDLPYKTNVEGTTNVLEAAGMAGVKKIVITSTAGTMGFSHNGTPVNEETNKDPDYHTEYERTKSASEKIAFETAAKGLNVTVVNPSRVFGPGKLTKSNSITRIMKMYGQGLWRIIPGDGNSIGNYAYIDDIVNGHILAALNGKSGERYILGGENVSFNRLFESLGKAYGKSRLMMKIDEANLNRIAAFTGFFLGLAGKPPLITSSWIEKYLKNWSLSSNKAITGLSYNITPFDEAIATTAYWCQSGKIT
jgi:farnesol dehydrogenase